jgi:bla regulator protein blaR1
MQEIIIRCICRTLLHSLWQGLLLAAVAAMMIMITKKSGSALRYKLLCSLLIVFVTGVSFTFCREIIVTINPLTTYNHSSAVYKQLPDTNLSAGNNFISADNIHKLTSTCTALLNDYSWLLVLIWFFIFLFHFVKLLLGMVNAERMRYYKTNGVNDEWNEKLQVVCNRMHISKPVLLMESALLKVPVLIGYVKPLILIPVGMLTQLSGEQVEAILMHELAHVRRHDYLVNLIQNAIDTIFFFNPAVLWISALVRIERENCCDDIAISETRSRKQFVEALVCFNQYSNTINTNYSLSWVTGKSQLLHRVQRIINKKNESLRSAELMVLLAVLLFTGTAFITLRRTRESLVQTPVKTVTKTNKKTAPAKPAQAAATGQVTTATKATKKPLKINTVAVKPAVETVDAESANEAEESTVESNDAGPRADDLVSLQKQLKAMGYRENDLAQLQMYLDHGVSAEYIQTILSLGYSKISMELFVRLKDHGVHHEFLSDLKKQGYGNVDLDIATNLIDHGVSAGFIEGFKKIGFKNISLEEATELKDHDVTTEFIEQFKKKTGQYLSLEDYIKLKDSGISPV